MKKFIVFEGPDGCGKSTMAERLYDNLVKDNKKVLLFREPGSTVNGEKIRSILLDGNPQPSHRTEAYLMAAARAELVEDKILPALENEYIVLLDRYLPSSLVYQGIVRGLGHEKIYDLNQLAIKGLYPSLSLYYQVSWENTLERRGLRQELDNFESQSLDFHKSVHQAYQYIYNEYKKIFNFIAIDGNAAIDEVFYRTLEAIGGLL